MERLKRWERDTGSALADDFSDPGLPFLVVAGYSPAPMVLTDPARGAMPTPELCQQLREIHGLTTAEAGVAAWAAQGIGLPEVGQILGITVNTVRTHVRRVFHKTGVRSQAELARQVERLGPLLADSTAEAGPVRVPAPERSAERRAAAGGMPRARAGWANAEALRDGP